jgi:hypothetical protein
MSQDQFSQEQCLKFPDDRVVGRIYVQPYSKNIDWSRLHVGSAKSPWRLLGYATGEVRVPIDHLSLLVTALPVAGDLQFLEESSNNTLDALHIYIPETSQDALQPLRLLFKLRSLTIAGGTLTTTLVSPIERLEALESLTLGASLPCTLSGADVLAYLSQTPHLKSLRLHNLHLEGISNQVLPNLTKLAISFNAKPTKSGGQDWLRWLTKLPTLQSLRIRVQDLDGRSLYPLGSVPSLESLDLEEVLLDKDIVPTLGSLVNLRRLKLDNVVFWGGGVRFLSQLESLQELTLHSESLYEEDLAAIASAPNLQWLSLAYTELHGRVDRLAAATKLTYLDLSGTKFDADTFTDFSVLDSLETFDVSDTDCTDNTLQFLYGCQSLQALRLNGCQNVTEVGIRALRSHSGIRELDLSYIAADGKVLTTFSECEALEYLSLCGLQVGSQIRAISHISTLETLELDNAILHPGALTIVSSMNSLEYLSLLGANVPESELGCLGSLKNLQELHLPAITMAPDWITTLPCLEALTLCSILFDESHWSAIARCPSLQQLTLYNTRIASNFDASGLMPDKVEQIYLPGTDFHDSLLLTRITAIPSLCSLNLSGSNANQADLKAISGHPTLRHLGLSGVVCSPEELFLLDFPALESFSGIYIIPEYLLSLRLWEHFPWCWSAYSPRFL